MPKSNQNDATKSPVDQTKAILKKAVLATLSAPYEGTVGNFLQHGATEVANMVLHGHAAPVYSHSGSPAEATTQDVQLPQQISGPEVKASATVQLEPAELKKSQGTVHGQASKLTVESAPIHGLPTSEPESSTQGRGILASYMEKLASYEPEVSHEQDLSR